VLGLLVLEFVVTGVLLALGVPWPSLLASAGPVIALTLALLNPTVQELGRRQPRLSVTTSNGKDRVVAPADRPWPVDADRVVENEVADARETANRRHSVLDNFLARSEPFAVRPTQADHEQAREEFEKEVDAFEAALRGWLTEYTDAAHAYADTFEVSIVVRNAASGAHAEAVTLILDLPETVEAGADRPTLSPPPDRPSYQPPRPRVPTHDLGFRRPPFFGTSASRPIEIPTSLRNPSWNAVDGGKQLEASAGDVHPGREVAVGEPLVLRAFGPGRHVIGWTAYTKSARRSAAGTIALEIPPDPARPAFGRLHGIVSYPDAPLVDEDGKVVRAVRDSEPATRPEHAEEDDGPLTALREANALARWRMLGLDPADDGPEKVQVGEAEKASP